VAARADQRLLGSGVGVEEGLAPKARRALDLETQCVAPFVFEDDGTTCNSGRAATGVDAAGFDERAVPVWGLRELAHTAPTVSRAMAGDGSGEFATETGWITASQRGLPKSAGLRGGVAVGGGQHNFSTEDFMRRRASADFTAIGDVGDARLNGGGLLVWWTERTQVGVPFMSTSKPKFLGDGPEGPESRPAWILDTEMHPRLSASANDARRKHGKRVGSDAIDTGNSRSWEGSGELGARRAQPYEPEDAVSYPIEHQALTTGE
jgi:hypothetical protein